MAEVVKDTRFGDTKAMLLFENPQDLLKAIEAGVDIKEVNIGSMAHSKGKVVVTNAVAMGDDDVKTQGQGRQVRGPQGSFGFLRGSRRHVEES